jgi:hypothetical protein
MAGWLDDWIVRWLDNGGLDIAGWLDSWIGLDGWMVGRWPDSWTVGWWPDFWMA